MTTKPRALVAALFTAAILTGGCAGTPGGEPRTTPEPTSPIGSVAPSPTASPTPSQEELSAEAERVYRTFFAEWKRLEREGGADEPTQVMLDNGAEIYLESVMKGLRLQKAEGIHVEGPPALTTVRASPGPTDKGDPRYTLTVCEDYTGSYASNESGGAPGRLIQGKVYLRNIGGRLKLVSAATEEVTRCAI